MKAGAAVALGVAIAAALVWLWILIGTARSTAPCVIPGHARTTLVECEAR